MFLFKYFQKYWAVITVFELIVITALSLWPIDQLPELTGTDKHHHLISYACLTIPVVFANRQHWEWFAVAFFCFSGTLELLQPYVSRYGEWQDLMANGVGIMAGIFIAKLLRNLMREQLDQ